MKRSIIILLIMTMFPVIKVAAQNPNLEKLNAYKVGFFTKRLNLTSEEAEKFWPVYNEYQKQKNHLQVERASIIESGSIIMNLNQSTLNDNQLTELGDGLVGILASELQLAISFHEKLKKVLTPAKVIMFYQAETQYKTQLLKELQGRQQQRPIPRRGL